MAMDKSNGRINYPLIMNLIFFIFGLVLVVSPRSGLTNLTVILAICLFCLTLVLVGIFFANRQKKNELFLLIAAGSLILGILMVYFREPIGTVILPIIAGAWMLVSAGTSVYAALRYRKFNAPLWWLPLVAALVAIVLAILIFFNLGATSAFLSILLGLYFLVYNAIRIGEWFTIRRHMK